MTPSERIAELERDHERLLALCERLMALAEHLVGVEPPPPRPARAGARCRTPLHYRHTRGDGRP